MYYHLISYRRVYKYAILRFSSLLVLLSLHKKLPKELRLFGLSRLRPDHLQLSLAIDLQVHSFDILEFDSCSLAIVVIFVILLGWRLLF